MASYTLSEIGKMTGGKLAGDGTTVIRHLVTDSRQVISPGDSLFVAIEGSQRDGHQYIEECYGKGIRAFMVKEGRTNSAFSDAGWIEVPRTLEALQLLAAHHRSAFHIPVIGITGSNGKTIVKEWISQLVQPDKRLVRSPRSFNSQTGVPLSVWLMSEEHELAVFEAGISLPGEMDRLESILRPDIGIMTNIGQAHQENFTDLQSKAREKLRLFRRSSTLIYCADHQVISLLIHDDPSLALKETITWSMRTEADLMIRKITARRERSLIEGSYRGASVMVNIPFTDEASVENAIHVWLLLLWMGYAPGMIGRRMEKLIPVAMRLEMKKGLNRCTLINDTYNSDLVSLRVGLDYLNRQNQHKHKTLILSDILQSGVKDKELYLQVASAIAAHGISRFFGIGPGLFEHARLFDPGARFFRTTEEFLQQVGQGSFSEEAILLKGSRIFRFEKISKILEERVHQTVLEIDLNAMVHNLNFFRSKLSPATRIMAMVKAFSYGSGSHEIASLLQFHRVDYLAVAYTDEGVELREAGIHLPVMVMNPEEQGYEAMIAYRLEPEIYGFSGFEKFSSIVRRYGEYGYPVHLKIDTGMHRLGFVPAEIDDLISRLSNQDAIQVRSVFSHLSSSDDPAEDSFTRSQIELFTSIYDRLASVLPYRFMKHILNSAGIERFPLAAFDMVRLGIGLYGISSSCQESLQQVGTLKSVVSQVKRVNPGDSIGYNRSGRATGKMDLAVVPVGYADGLNRKLGNGKGKLWLKGHLAPLVGNICMDMCMIDVTGLNAKEGDEVIVFGKELSVTQLAEWMDTIPYEILTGVSGRVRRVYYQD